MSSVKRRRPSSRPQRPPGDPIGPDPTGSPADPTSPRARPARLRPGPQLGDADAVHRARLLDALVVAVADKGYAATTIADVVAVARVSRRTFYELFADKEACYLAAFDALVERLMDDVDRAVAAPGPWDARLTAGLDAYLGPWAADPAAARVFLVEGLAAGPRFAARRRRVFERWVTELRMLVRTAREDDPAVRAVSRELSADMAHAVVGGLHELVLVAAEENRLDSLVPRVRDVAAELLRAVLIQPEDPAPAV